MNPVYLKTFGERERERENNYNSNSLSPTIDWKTQMPKNRVKS